MTVDIDALRRDTPWCANLLHLNNAGASLPPRQVLRVVTDYLALEARVGAYEAERREAERLDAFYDVAARLVGGHRDEIAFVENATRAWDLVFYSIDWQKGDKVLTCLSEYVAGYLPMLQMARRRGIEVEVVPNDEHGQVDVGALEGMIDPRVRLIAMTHVPTNGGLVNPVAGVGAVAKRHDVPFLLDACQSVGQLKVDVQAIGCDMLTASGRKYLRGPRGTGFLWVRKAWLEKLDPVFVDGRAASWDQADSFTLRTDGRRFECWESFVAGRLGLAKAMAYALDIGLDAIEQRVVDLADQLRQRLDDVDGVMVRDLGERRCGIVTFTWEGLDLPKLVEALRSRRINVSLTDIGSTRLDMEARGLERMVRASVHAYNTEDELERFVEALASLESRCRLD